MLPTSQRVLVFFICDSPFAANRRVFLAPTTQQGCHRVTPWISIGRPVRLRDSSGVESERGDGSSAGVVSRRTGTSRDNPGPTWSAIAVGPGAPPARLLVVEG